MKTLVVAWLFAGLLTVAAETPDEVAAALARKALTNSGAVEIVRDLTTDIGPRLAGSEGEKRAAVWAEKRFEQLGFDKVWIENFPLEHGWERGIETAEVISPSPQRLVITALGDSVATPAEGIVADIALFKTYDEFLATPTNLLSGKIVVVTERMARARDGHGYGEVNKIRNRGPAEAARRGAAAYLSRSLATNNRRVAHAGHTSFPENGLRIPAAALSVPDAEQLERLVAKGGPVRVKLVLTPREFRPATSQNVIAEIKGREKPDEIVLLGAHLDSWDLATGALDDGAGVGVVMATAKLIRDLPQHPKRTIRVVLFGSEEPGLFGGHAYAKAHASEINRYVVVAEPDEGQGPVYGFQTGVANPDESSLQRIRAALSLLGITAGDNKSKGSSDVEPLAALGVPAVTLQLDSMDYFDFHHTADDTFDKINPERINQTAAAYAVFAYLAAELGGEYRANAALSNTPAADLPDDAKAIQGKWEPVSAELAGKPMPDTLLKTISLKMDNGKYEVFVGQQPDRGTYTLDAIAKPAGITVIGTEGPNQGKTFPAIYELNGDTLRICYDLSGAKRPTEFKSVAGTRLYLVTYRRHL